MELFAKMPSHWMAKRTESINTHPPNHTLCGDGCITWICAIICVAATFLWTLWHCRTCCSGNFAHCFHCLLILRLFPHGYTEKLFYSYSCVRLGCLYLFQHKVWAVDFAELPLILKGLKSIICISTKSFFKVKRRQSHRQQGTHRTVYSNRRL